ncbi:MULTISPECIES: hypothetical protein [Streptomyces]|uniref:Uncharacterized protein n=1 Tax=Streptomyces durocortorensis TaxID=2811104 RepID=A0ABS2HUE9_9ACTN|nr:MULTISPECIES: hypothetical protein [Streptomyces]MBM7054300.1 hypothetical protein [Streptomyces durocortorensis]MCL6293279.1 hypothetical protein [Streptomyces sp. 43Y-GA-1]
MKRILATSIISFTAVFGVMVAAPTASADVIDYENLYSSEGCKEPTPSKFKFHIYFNSGMDGSYRNIGYSVYDFDRLKPGGSDPGAYPLRFCIIGASGTPGAGQKIKNNAASAENDHYKYKARVHFYSGYTGPKDVMNPGQTIARFRYVYNENASFSWA